MATARVSASGRITLPAQVRDALGLRAGDRLTFVEQPDGSFVIQTATGSVQALKGLIARPAKPVSIEDMNQAIATQAAR